MLIPLLGTSVPNDKGGPVYIVKKNYNVARLVYTIKLMYFNSVNGMVLM